MHVEAQVRNVERELRLTGTLKKIVVNTQCKIRQTGEAIRSTESSILCLRVGIEASKSQVGKVSVRKLNSEPERMASAQVTHVVGKLPEDFIRAAARKTRITKLQIAASPGFAAGGAQQDCRKHGIH